MFFLHILAKRFGIQLSFDVYCAVKSLKVETDIIVRTEFSIMYGENTKTIIMQSLYIQVNKKFCELKGGNIGIVEKAQETRFGMSPKYSR